MENDLSASARKVQDALKELGVNCEVVEMPATTRSARDAAAALGCRVEQICKSLIFRATVTKRPILVIASGPNRVNEAMLARIVGEPIERADADFVRARTGFAIGGVPPVGHSEPIETYIDQSLLAEVNLWAAGGTPLAVFRLTPAILREITRGRVIAIT